MLRAERAEQVRVGRLLVFDLLKDQQQTEESLEELRGSGRNPYMLKPACPRRRARRCKSAPGRSSSRHRSNRGAAACSAACSCRRRRHRHRRCSGCTRKAVSAVCGQSRPSLQGQPGSTAAIVTEATTQPAGDPDVNTCCVRFSSCCRCCFFAICACIGWCEELPPEEVEERRRCCSFCCCFWSCSAPQNSCRDLHKR